MKKFHLLLGGLLAIHLFLLLNLQFTAWPEMFSYAYLKNNGFLLYKDIIHPYPPFLTLVLSYTYRVFGYSLIVLQTVSWLTILASGVLVFLISQKITKSKNIALFTLGIFVFLQPFLEGNMLWFDIAIVLPILLGAFFTLRWIDKEDNQKLNIFLVGLFFGIASLIKQTAGIFWIAFFTFLIFRKAKKSEFLHFLAGPIILWGIFLGRIIQENQLVEFWNWTIFYPLFRWGNFPGYVQMALSPRELITLGIFLIPVMLYILFYILWQRRIKDTEFWLLIIFLIAGLIAIYPRFSFFHFQPSLVFFVMIYGYILSKLNLKWQVLFLVSFFALLYPLIYKPAFETEWGKETRFYGREEKETALLIKSRIGDSRNIYLLGLPSQFYPMTDTVPPKPWTDNFGWYLEIPGVQENVVKHWEANPPDFVFWRSPSPGNWFDLGTYQPQKIVQWIKENYTKKEEVAPEVWLWEKKL